MNRVTCTLMFLAGLLGACTEPNPAFNPDPYLPGECREGLEREEVFESFERPEKLDVLFVVDRTGDTKELQSLLASAVGPFLIRLETAGADVRTAAITTDRAEGVGLAPPGTIAEGCADNRTQVAEGSHADWIAATACNIVQGEAAEAAFDEPLASIDGFLKSSDAATFVRPDARLLIVVAAKDDDCSSDELLTGDSRDVCRSAANLWDERSVVRQWRETGTAMDAVGFAVFAGPPSSTGPGETLRPVCSSTIGSVFPASRLFRTAEEFGAQGFFFSACTDDMFAPLNSVVAAYLEEGTLTFCPAAKLVHEPLSVQVERNGQPDEVPLGEEGFTYLGPIADCENGALQFQSEALRGAKDLTIEYCVEVQ